MLGSFSPSAGEVGFWSAQHSGSTDAVVPVGCLDPKDKAG